MVVCVWRRMRCLHRLAHTLYLLGCHFQTHHAYLNEQCIHAAQTACQMLTARCNHGITARCNNGITARCNHGITARCNHGMLSLMPASSRLYQLCCAVACAAGFVGIDTFSYTVANTTLKANTATVTVNVTVGSCEGSSCTVGTCNVTTGAHAAAAAAAAAATLSARKRTSGLTVMSMTWHCCGLQLAQHP
jgi:hypothetical protein